MPVGLVIVSHSAQLAAGVAELIRQMAQGKTPIAAAGGAGAPGEQILGTSVDKILAAIQSVDSPAGVLVLLDLGSAILSAEMALEFLDEEQRSRVQFTIAPLVEGSVAAALEASLGRSLSEVKQAAERTATREQLQLLKPLSQVSQPEAEAEMGTSGEESVPLTPVPTTAPPVKPEANVLEASLPITNPTGLHARPASLFVQTAAQYNADIEVASHGKSANATNIIGVLSLGVRQGDTITLRLHGPQAEAALATLSEMVRANFYETEPLPVEGATISPPAQEISSPAAAQETPPGAAAVEAAEVWKGIPTSPGVALGPAFVATASHLSLKAVERRPITAEQVAAEQRRLREALISAAEELQTLASNLQSSIGQEQAAIFDAQALMLSDEVLLEEALDRIAGQHIDAASALADAGEQQAMLLEGLDNTLLAARSADVRDAVGRAVRSLRGQLAPAMNLSELTSQVILLVHDLTPSDTAQLRPETVLGICTVLGGPTAHAAILARALGIPAMAGLNEAALEAIHTGDELGLDADAGLLAVHPAEQTRAQLAGRIAERQARQAALRAEAQQVQAPLTIGNRHISLLANVGSEAEAEAARQWGAEGIGLLRTEFLFGGAATLPDEEAQRQRYVQVFRAFIGPTPRNAGPVVVRTLDAGADKPMPALEAILGPGGEANPALGLRGIRIHLAHPSLLEQQLSALLRAAAETGIDLHIMFPMISTVEEVRAVRAIFERVYAHLQQRSVAVPAHVPLGIMVEVPSAALMAPELAELVDFFSIGANDLLQYTLASDRTNTAVSHLYQATQPAVLRLIQQIAQAGRRAGKPVAVCGEIASEVRLAPLLVALGVDELSMTPTALPTVRAALTGRTAQELKALAERIGPLKTVAEVEQELP